MNSFCVSVLAALAVFSTPVFSMSVLQSEDKFKDLFEAEAPIKETIAELMTIDPFTNYQHFQTIQQHIRKNDKHASYGKKLIAAGQKMLDHMLREINHNEKVDVVTFVNAAYNIVSGTSPVRDTKMFSLAMELNSYLQKLFEDALEKVKKNIMEKLLGSIDGIENQEAAAKQEETPKIQDAAEENVIPKKRSSQTRRSKSSSTVSEPKNGTEVKSERKLRRSTASKPVSG